MARAAGVVSHRADVKESLPGASSPPGHPHFQAYVRQAGDESARKTDKTSSAIHRCLRSVECDRISVRNTVGIGIDLGYDTMGCPDRIGDSCRARGFVKLIPMEQIGTNRTIEEEYHTCRQQRQQG